MNRLLSTAKADSQGKRPDGKCYMHVCQYMNKDGYGGIKAGSVYSGTIPSKYLPYAHDFADFLNTGGNAARLGLLNIQQSVQNNPYNAPAGSIVVVRAGTPGTRNPVAGDITVADGASGLFWNGGRMGYGGSSNFPPSNNHVLGIYVPTKCTQFFAQQQFDNTTEVLV